MSSQASGSLRRARSDGCWRRRDEAARRSAPVPRARAVAVRSGSPRGHRDRGRRRTAVRLAGRRTRASTARSSQLTSGLVGHRGFSSRRVVRWDSTKACSARCSACLALRSAAPVLEAQANVVGPAGARSVDLIGADPRFVALGGSLLRHFSAATLARQHALALPRRLPQQIGADSLQLDQAPNRREHGTGSAGRHLAGKGHRRARA